MMDQIEGGNFQLMDSMHHLCSGFKALFTTESVSMIDEARKTCGGAGFAAFSGFTGAYDNRSPDPTQEGDNTVMLQQACNYLFKCLKKAKDGAKLPFPYSYLNRIESLLALQNHIKSVE